MNQTAPLPGPGRVPGSPSPAEPSGVDAPIAGYAAAGPAAGPTVPGPSWPPVGPPPAQAPPGAARPGGRRPVTAVVTAAVVAALVGGAAGFGGAYLAEGRTSSPVLGSVSSATTSTADGTVAGAAAVATPSTVDIRVTTARGAAEGSGVVLTADGAVLTNNHVVAEAASGNGSITVTLADGSQHPARVVGTSPSYDIAVLRMDGATGLTPAALGRSADLTVGQQVVAIGSPQGLEGTVTTGIVSALNRTVAVAGDGGQAVVYNGLQTDAPINQGNSGGPLVDLSGHVVGINSAIATAGQQSTGSIGLGFAIPIDQARRVAQEILDSGVATKPLLGVQGSGGGSLAGGFGGSDGTGATGGSATGATVQAVTSGSPAASAGIVAGDTVLQVGDARVADFTDLVARIGAHAPGETVTLTVRSADGQQRQVQVTLASTEDRAPTTSNRVVPGGLN
ncbi:S1C family serine protease [Pseudonocardia sp.]|uniref:S1C family serine protease n=1 Tax=Pseudonocardia sp. TaxID=60912 RepID=UPI003D0E7938